MKYPRSRCLAVLALVLTFAGVTALVVYAIASAREREALAGELASAAVDSANHAREALRLSDLAEKARRRAIDLEAEALSLERQALDAERLDYMQTAGIRASLVAEMDKQLSSLRDSVETERAKNRQLLATIVNLQSESEKLQAKTEAFERVLINLGQNSIGAKSTDSSLGLLVATASALSGLSAILLSWRADNRANIELRLKLAAALKPTPNLAN